MLKEKEYEKLIDEWVDRYDFIYDIYYERDFCEIVGSIGGDVERTRVYKDGGVYAK